MKTIYAVFLLVLAVIIFFMSLIEKKKDKTRVGDSIALLLMTATVTLTLYSLGLLAPGSDAALVFFSIYYASADMLLYCMLLYTTRFTYSKRAIRAMIVIFIMTAADSVSMLLNIFFRHCFVCVEAADFTGETFFGPQFGEFAIFLLHKCVVMSLFCMSVFVLVYRMVRTPAIYHDRARRVLYSLVIVVAANVLQNLLDLKIDPSLAFYSIIAVTVFYYSIIFVPTRLIDSFLTYVAKDMDGLLICFDIDNRCIFANKKALTLYRADNNLEKLGAGFRQWMGDDPEKKTDDFTWTERRRIGGKDYYLHNQFKHLKDNKGKAIGSFFLTYDETDEMRKLEEERYRMNHDELTGIYNKKHFYEKTRERLDKAKSGEYCMITTDVRDFKLINDMFGIKKGDEILIGIARTIAKFAKEGTVYGRISGDRYAICMPSARYTDELFEREIARLSSLIDSKLFQLRIHVGYYLITNNEMPVPVIIDRANIALRSIKNSYTSVIAAYDEKMRAARISEQKITAEFDQAIAEGQFRMFLQPQISVSGETIGAEALVRWEHPVRGMIPPAEFIGVFERTGLIARMDEYVWELACRQLQEWKQEGHGNYHISVNISPKDFFFTDIYRKFTELVHKYDIDPKNLRLEITETALMNDFSKQLMLIDRLREYGFAVEMDDFGSGYSSLNMLKEINVDTLKIDMGFLQRSETASPERSAAIIDMIIALSKKLGMEVITEGVETREQVDFLTDAGCDVFQGYYFAKPMRVSDFEEKYFYAERA